MPAVNASRIDAATGSATIAGLFLIGLAPIASAQTEPAQPPVTLRAGSTPISASIDRYVATHALPQKLDPANLSSDRLLTPRDVMQRLCGGVREEYYAQLKRANRAQRLPLDRPLGPAAATVQWPACLYATFDVETSAGFRCYAQKCNAVQRGYNPGKEFTVVIGEARWQWPTRKSRAPLQSDYVSSNDVPYTVIARLLQGQEPLPEGLEDLLPYDKLMATLITAPVSITPRQDAQSFVHGLNELTGAEGGAGVRVVESDTTGRIVQPVEVDPGATASDPRSCVDSNEPYPATLTLNTFKFALERAALPSINVAPGQAEVVIVDNGFFGADTESGQPDPFAGSPFAQRFFRPAASGTIARRLAALPHWPINRRAGAVVSSEMGHGTHVAGLALGGPGFAGFRSAIPRAVKPWIQLTVLNVADGRRTLTDKAEHALGDFLGAPGQYRVVNMSIAYDGRTSTDTGAVFQNIFTSAPDSLFVLAAGNGPVGGDPFDVSEEMIVPANFGGPQASNVVTVAALDGNRRLAPFSNFGASSVDLAAPGCALMSWLDNSPTPTALSGTSQATPVVTFAASLLRHIAPKLPAHSLKTRLIASGRLLPASEHDKVANRVGIDIPHALLWFDDLLIVRGAQEGTYVGKMVQANGLRCAGARTDKDLRTLWSFKRDTDTDLTWIYSGRDLDTIKSICAGAASTGGSVYFLPEFRLRGDKFEAIAATDEPTAFALDDVLDLVMRSEFDTP